MSGPGSRQDRLHIILRVERHSVMVPSRERVDRTQVRRSRVEEIKIDFLCFCRNQRYLGGDVCESSN